jgi:hypothetical protein
VTLFFPSIGPAAPFEMRQQKTWSSAPKIRRDEKGKQQRKKGKKSDGGCSCKVLFSLFGVVKILSFMMIQPPSLAFNVLLQFNPSI